MFTAVEVEEELTDDDGRVHAAQYLSRTFRRTSRTSSHVLFAVLDVVVPSSGVKSIPILVSAIADGLPDDDPQKHERLMIRVGPSHEDEAEAG